MTTPPHSNEVGATGEPLPHDAVVIRLAKPSKEGRVSEAAFTLSSRDEDAPLLSLSVWGTSRITEAQARGFLGETGSEYHLAPRLAVQQIRALRPTPDSPDVPHLNVIWNTLLIEEHGVLLPDSRPGAEGHAGMTGLKRPAQMPKSYYKSLRSQLTDLADASLLLGAA